MIDLDEKLSEIDWNKPPYINPPQSLIVDVYNKLEQHEITLDEFRIRWIEILDNILEKNRSLESERDTLKEQIELEDKLKQQLDELALENLVKARLMKTQELVEKWRKRTEYYI